MSERILLVDDEAALVKGLRRSLEQAGFEVEVATDGRQALERFAAGGIDLIILDLMLPEVDGLTVCREVRKTSQVPIIMLTARDEDVDRIVGLELGADDYVVKPFNPRELIARIRAVLRRVSRPAGWPLAWPWGRPWRPAAPAPRPVGPAGPPAVRGRRGQPPGQGRPRGRRRPGRLQGPQPRGRARGRSWYGDRCASTGPATG